MCPENFSSALWEGDLGMLAGFLAWRVGAGFRSTALPLAAVGIIKLNRA
jgi:hypothetical protein